MLFKFSFHNSWYFKYLLALISIAGIEMVCISKPWTWFLDVLFIYHECILDIILHFRNELVSGVEAAHVSSRRLHCLNTFLLLVPNTFLHGFIGVWGNHLQILPRLNLLDYETLSSTVLHEKVSNFVLKVNDSCSCDQIRFSFSLSLRIRKADYLKQIKWVETAGCVIWLFLMACISNEKYTATPLLSINLSRQI